MVATAIDHLPLPPGNLGLPFLGMPPRLLDSDYLQAQYQQYGGVFKTRVLGRNLAVFAGPEANRFVLQEGAKYFIWREGWPGTFKELLGESLFVQDGDDHRQKRRLIVPAFHREALHNYLATMEDITKLYLDRWFEKGEFHWLEQFKQFTFEIASTLLTGSIPGNESEQLSKYFNAMTNGFLTVPLRWSWTPYGKALHGRNKLLEYIDAAIENRRQNPTRDALSLLVQSRDEEGNALTNHELQAQTLLLLFAGHETSASMLTSMCMMLAQYPDVWEKARAEQEALNIVGDLEMAQMKQMPYLEQILKEVERMFPPVPAGFRRVIETFEFNGYRIPEGWTGLYMINAAHRDPNIYTDPNAFDPDRFSPERNENNIPYSLVGFGGGARVCVGFAFAQLEMKVMASHLLRHYTWTLKPDQNLNTRYFPTLMPKDGLQVTFKRL